MFCRIYSNFYNTFRRFFFPSSSFYTEILLVILTVCWTSLVGNLETLLVMWMGMLTLSHAWDLSSWTRPLRLLCSPERCVCCEHWCRAGSWHCSYWLETWSCCWSRRLDHGEDWVRIALYWDVVCEWWNWRSIENWLQCALPVFCPSSCFFFLLVGIHLSVKIGQTFA